LLDDELDEALGETNLLSVLMEVLQVLRTLLRLVQVFVLKKHDSDCQIQHEEGADNDTEQEVEVDKPCLIGISIDVADVDPSLQGDALENCQECTRQVVETRVPKVQVLDGAVSYDVNAWVDEVSRVCRTLGLGQGATPSVHRAKPLAAAKACVFWICNPVTILRELGHSTPLVDLSGPKGHAKDGKNGKEEDS
jgi:hypothetical protein